MRLVSCQPVGKGCCGRLVYDSRCAACSVAASLASLADIRGSIVFVGLPEPLAPVFLRNIEGRVREHGESSLYGEVLAELLGVDSLPLQRVLNELLRIPMNLTRALVVWAHGEQVSLRRLFLPAVPRMV